MELARRLVKFVIFYTICFGNVTTYYSIRGRIAHLLVNWGLYERASMCFLSTLALDGRVVMDVGAGFGVYTKRLSKLVGSTGVVHAFEANPDMCRYISEHVPGRNVQLHNVALSNTNTTESLYVPRICYGIPEPALATLGSGERAKKGSGENIEVCVRRADDLGFDLDDVAFIKSDIEGFDREFIRGAVSIIRRHRPVIQFEENSPQNIINEFKPLADELDYRLCELHNGCLREYRDFSVERHIFYFVPVETLK